MSFKVYASSESSVLQVGIEELLLYGKGAFTRTDTRDKADIVLESDNSSKFNDSFSLKSENGRLYIRGSNPRSVLYGIFDYLRYFGFDFLYPGKEGEIIPENPAFTIDGFDCQSSADRQFRGIAASPNADNLQQGYDLIRFLVQNKYNIYFLILQYLFIKYLNYFFGNYFLSLFSSLLLVLIVKIYERINAQISKVIPHKSSINSSGNCQP